MSAVGIGSRRPWHLRLALAAGSALGVLTLLGGLLTALAWWLLPRLMPDLVIAQSPWVEPMARAVVGDAQPRSARAQAMAERCRQLGPVAVPALARLLDHRDPAVRTLVAGWLVAVPAPATVGMPAVADADTVGRLLAGLADAGHDQGSREAVQGVQTALALDCDLVGLRRAAQAALIRLHALDLARAPAVDSRLSALRVLAALRRREVIMASELTDAVRPALADGAVAVRVAAVEELGWCVADARVAPLLAVALRDPAPEVIDAADRMLGTRYFSLDAAERAARAQGEAVARAHLAGLIRSGGAAGGAFARHVLRSLLRDDAQRAAYAGVLAD